MADPAAGLKADRALRNAARRLLDSDLAAIRGAVAGHKAQAQALAGQAAAQAKAHRGGIGAGLALAGVALAGWLLRDRIGALKDSGETDAEAPPPPDEGQVDGN